MNKQKVKVENKTTDDDSVFDLSKLAHHLVEEAFLYPEIVLKQADEVYKFVIAIKPNETIRNPRDLIIKSFRDEFRKKENGVKIALNKNTTDSIRSVVGYSEFIAHLFNRGLVDLELLNNLMFKILNDDRNKFIKLRVMKIVKDKIKKLTNEGNLDKNLHAIKMAMEKEKVYDDGEFLPVKDT